MNTPFPPIADIRARLGNLSYLEIEKLAAESDVPFTTLLKIRNGVTTNPGIETVRKFWPKVPQPIAKAA